jgi:hypothetical protein
MELVGVEQYSSIFSIAAFLEKLLLLLRSWVQLPPGPFLLILELRNYGIKLRSF